MLRFFREMTKANGRCVTTMHLEEHGIEGMAGSLDCIHVKWKNSPIAWQGQYQGNQGCPTIVMEVFCDFNIWFWHAVISFPGSLNVIWGQIPLHQSFIDGTFSDLDFAFEINEKNSEDFLMATGIYPELAWFVKSFQEPIEKSKIYYSKWQEGAQKNIERAFGVLQRKFQVLTHPFKQWLAGDIHDIVMTCVILYNAMVSVKIDQNQEESNGFYNYLDLEDGDKLVDCSVAPNQEEVEGVEVAQL